jgi:hypothetical protein
VTPTTILTSLEATGEPAIRLEGKEEIEEVKEEINLEVKIEIEGFKDKLKAGVGPAVKQR